MPNKPAPNKGRLGVILDQSLKAKLTAEAKRRGMTASSLTALFIREALSESAMLSRVLSDPAARRLLVDALQRPGAIESIMKFSGHQEDLRDIIGGGSEDKGTRG